MSEVCSDCQFSIQDFPDLFCIVRKLSTKDGLFENCHCFLPKTIFDRITASPEVLAEKLVYVIKQLFTISGTSRENAGGYEVKTKWFSTIVDGDFDSKAEAIAATVMRLKEVTE